MIGIETLKLALVSKTKLSATMVADLSWTCFSFPVVSFSGQSSFFWSSRK